MQVRYLILAILILFMVFLGLSMAVVLTAPKSHAAVVVRSSPTVTVRSTHSKVSLTKSPPKAQPRSNSFSGASSSYGSKTHSSAYKPLPSKGATQASPKPLTKRTSDLMSFELECTHQPNTAGVYTCILEDD